MFKRQNPQNDQTSHHTIRRGENAYATKGLYYTSPRVERKVSLSSTVIISVFTLIVGFVVGINWRSLSAQFAPYLIVNQRSANAVDFNSLNTVYDALVDHYDGDIDQSRVIEEAKRGIVAAAGDDYTYFMTAAEAKEFNNELEGDVGAGIGVEIGARDGYTKVLRTTPDNPARAAGVLAGDIVYKVDDVDVTGKSTDDVAKLLRGTAGTTVKLTVVRNNKEVDFTLTREIINNVSAYIEYRDHAAILTISRFDSNTGALVRQLAKDAINKNVQKIILDLRGNGGGYVSAAKEVASLWIDGKLVVEQKSSNGSYDEKTYADSGQAILANIKTVVLINGSTASASEIVAGALQDYSFATILGEQSYGKGSVQSLENLTGGEVLRVTVAKWYTPNGKNINKSGITPDQTVTRSFDQINKDEDPQLDAALSF